MLQAPGISTLNEYQTTTQASSLKLFETKKAVRRLALQRICEAQQCWWWRHARVFFNRMKTAPHDEVPPASEVRKEVKHFESNRRKGSNDGPAKFQFRASPRHRERRQLTSFASTACSAVRPGRRIWSCRCARACGATLQSLCGGLVRS